jgi:hypothetical protein
MDMEHIASVITFWIIVPPLAVSLAVYAVRHTHDKERSSV